MPYVILVLFLLAFGSLIPSALSDKYSHNKVLRFVSFSLFALLTIARIVTPYHDIVAMVAGAISYAIVALMQLWVWIKLIQEDKQ